MPVGESEILGVEGNKNLKVSITSDRSYFYCISCEQVNIKTILDQVTFQSLILLSDTLNHWWRKVHQSSHQFFVCSTQYFPSFTNQWWLNTIQMEYVWQSSPLVRVILFHYPSLIRIASINAISVLLHRKYQFHFFLAWSTWLF